MPEPLKPCPPFAEGGIGSRLLRAMETYAENYVFDDGGGADHEPTEFERHMLIDMLNGAISDDAVTAILLEASLAMSSPSVNKGGE